MAIKTYDLKKAVAKSAESIAAVQQLAQGDIATTFLQSDTKFAVVVEAIEKQFNDSFSEWDANVATLSVYWSKEGAVGRFMGYLALSENKMRIYEALDLDITKPENTNPVQDVAEHSKKLELIFEDNISNIVSIMDNGRYVLTNNVKKYKLIQTYPIVNVNGKFQSKVGGFQDGLKPLFQYINSRGGHVRVTSTKSSVLVFIILLIVIVGFYLGLRFIGKQ